MNKKTESPIQGMDHLAKLHDSEYPIDIRVMASSYPYF
jgi:hypothetical protein